MFHLFSFLFVLVGCTQPIAVREPIRERSLVEPSEERSMPEEESQYVEASPKSGWTDFDVEAEKKKEAHSLTHKIFMWIPNRIVDLIDVFRVDVGVGPAAGGVVRVTKWGQAGIRTIAPVSVRVGDFGRDFPVKVEHSSELGVSPLFLQSRDRTVCPGEVGAGIDLFLIGGYLGICFDELFDFGGGLFSFDPKGDDF